MGRRVVVESGRDRKALVADAGWSQLSLVSVLAGVLVAYGAFALLAGIAGGILDATDASVDITARWNDLGVTAGLVVAGLLFLSYLFGGYVAGRMARRAGLVQGLAVFVFGVLVVAVVAVAIRALAGADSVVERLRDLGLPTTGDEWADVGTIAGLASLAAALVGAVAGGILGERWHAKLLSRAIDPDIGAEADARRTAELAAAEATIRHDESRERVDTASLRGLRETPAPAPVADVDRPVADVDRPVVDRAVVARRRTNGNGHGEDNGGARSGWYRDRNLDDVPDREPAPEIGTPVRDEDGWVRDDAGETTVRDDRDVDDDGPLSPRSRLSRRGTNGRRT